MHTLRRSFVALALAAPLLAAPHDPGLSSVHVSRTAERVHVHAAFANADFQAAASLDRDGNGAIDAAELASAGPGLADLVTSRFVLRDGEILLPATLTAARIAENADVELELSFAAPSGTASVAFEAAFLQRLSRGHRCYTCFVDAGGEVVTDALLTPARNRFGLPTIDAAVASGFAQSWSFFVFGIEHILIGFDHLAFLLALLVAGVAWRRVVATITAFTIAHSITLLAAALGVLRLPSLLVEATIAGSIVVVAAANLLQGRRPAHRWPLAFAFGLVHGFGFAGVLADLRVGGDAALLPLVTFNLGVEVGQLAFALVVVPLLAFAARRPWGRRVPGVVSIAVGAAGLFWLGQRLTG